jgi:hypothetical protein
MFKEEESFKYHNKVESTVIRNFVIRTKHAMSTDVSEALKNRVVTPWHKTKHDNPQQGLTLGLTQQ